MKINVVSASLLWINSYHTLYTLPLAPHSTPSLPHHTLHPPSRTTLYTLPPAPHSTPSLPHHTLHPPSRTTLYTLPPAPHSISSLPHHTLHPPSRTTLYTLPPAPHSTPSLPHHTLHPPSRTTLYTLPPAPHSTPSLPHHTLHPPSLLHPHISYTSPLTYPPSPPKYSRVFTALIRLQADPERLLFFLADLLKKPLLPNEIYIIMSVATIWPAPANKKKCVVNKTKEGLNLVALEEHLMRSTLEVAVLHKYNSEGKAAGVHEAVGFFLFLSVSLLCGTVGILVQQLTCKLCSQDDALIDCCLSPHCCVMLWTSNGATPCAGIF